MANHVINKFDMYCDIMQAIKENDHLVFYTEIPLYVNYCKQTIYTWFPVGSKEDLKIRAALDANKMAIKALIRSKLFKSRAAAELIALYKLVATQEERDALSMQKVVADVRTEITQITGMRIIDAPDETTTNGSDGGNV